MKQKYPMKCTYSSCNFEWNARKETPRACPQCHRYFDYTKASPKVVEETKQE